MEMQSLFEIALQIANEVGKVVLGFVFALWKSLPGIPNEFKVLLIGLVLLALLSKILKSPAARYRIQDIFDEIFNILTR